MNLRVNAEFSKRERSWRPRPSGVFVCGLICVPAPSFSPECAVDITRTLADIWYQPLSSGCHCESLSPAGSLEQS